MTTCVAASHNPTRQLYIHIVLLLNRRHAAGVLTRLIKVKAHFCEQLNEAANDLASAAAEADGAPMSLELHLDPCAVHFYLNHNAPVEWDSRVWKFLTLVGAFPGNDRLYKWKIRTSGACELCGAPAETQAHIQCVCVALKGARISAHHNLAGIVFSAIAAGGQGWMVYRELTLVGLQGLPVPAAAIAEWSRMCDEITDSDLETVTDAERALASGIRRKRPDGWAVHWGLRRVLVLEFTRANDYQQDWHEMTEDYKTERYRPLRDKMAAGLPPPWSVETVCFTL